MNKNVFFEGLRKVKAINNLYSDFFILKYVLSTFTGMTGTNTLAYCAFSSASKKMKCCEYTLCSLNLFDKICLCATTILFKLS
jgi:hypothetical protein